MRFLLLLLLVFSFSAQGQQRFEVYFDFNKDMPNSAGDQALKSWIASHPNAEVLEVAGFTDSVDENNYNKELSVRRIKSVLRILEQHNIAVSKNVLIQPVGESFQQSPDQSKNRKVTVVYADNLLNHDQDPGGSVVTDSIKEDVAALFADAKKGDLIRLKNIHFYRNKEEVLPGSLPLLDQLYEVMAANLKLSIEIHGHICCNPNPNDTRLSYRRAKYIFTYLLNRGIPLVRLSYKGFGSANPVYPIPEQSASEQLANRRVEILIVRK